MPGTTICTTSTFYEKRNFGIGLQRFLGRTKKRRSNSRTPRNVKPQIESNKFRIDIPLTIENEKIIEEKFTLFPFSISILTFALIYDKFMRDLKFCL
jgi:hypothetical protein